MAEEHGTKELDEFLAFLGVSISAGFEAKYNDGKIDLADLPLISAPALAAPAAFMGFGLIDDEVMDLSPEEAEASKEKLRIALKLPAGLEDVEEVVEDGMSHAVGLFAWSKKVLALAAKYR